MRGYVVREKAKKGELILKSEKYIYYFFLFKIHEFSDNCKDFLQILTAKKLFKGLNQGMYAGILQGVEHKVCFFSSGNNISFAQNSEVL